MHEPTHKTTGLDLLELRAQRPLLVERTLRLHQTRGEPEHLPAGRRCGGATADGAAQRAAWSSSVVARNRHRAARPAHMRARTHPALRKTQGGLPPHLLRVGHRGMLRRESVNLRCRKQRSAQPPRGGRGGGGVSQGGPYWEPRCSSVTTPMRSATPSQRRCAAMQLTHAHTHAHTPTMTRSLAHAHTCAPARAHTAVRTVGRISIWLARQPKRSVSSDASKCCRHGSMHRNTDARTRTHTHTHTDTCTATYTHTHTHVHAHAHTHTHKHRRRDGNSY
jgi:hypothetical protein